jgi:hypothetical protein
MELPDTYKKHFLAIELICALAVVIILYVLFSTNLDPDQLTNLMKNMRTSVYPLSSMGAITLLGFIITGVSILIAFLETPALRLIKNSKQYVNLFKIYFSAIKHLGFLTILSIIGILVDQPFLSLIIFYLVIFFIISSTLRTWRCLWVLEQFIEIIRSSSTPLTPH